MPLEPLQPLIQDTLDALEDSQHHFNANKMPKGVKGCLYQIARDTVILSLNV